MTTKTLSREITTYEKEVISVIADIANILKTDIHAGANYRESILRLESNILKLKAELNTKPIECPDGCKCGFCA